MLPHGNRPRRRYVCPWMVRSEFNDRRILEGVARGNIVEDAEPGSPPGPQTRLPGGTLSQTVWFKNQAGQPIARAHRYFCRDGLLAGSGFPDPKSIFNPGEVLLASHTDRETCPDCAFWEPKARASLLTLESYRRRGPLR
jgi:hypothetical protein